MTYLIDNNQFKFQTRNFTTTLVDYIVRLSWTRRFGHPTYLRTPLEHGLLRFYATRRSGQSAYLRTPLEHGRLQFYATRRSGQSAYLRTPLEHGRLRFYYISNTILPLHLSWFNADMTLIEIQLYRNYQSISDHQSSHSIYYVVRTNSIHSAQPWPIHYLTLATTITYHQFHPINNTLKPYYQ